MKTIIIKIAMTQEQYECLCEQSTKNADNSSIQAQLEASISDELRNMIDWSNTTVDSNGIDVVAS